MTIVYQSSAKAPKKVGQIRRWTVLTEVTDLCNGAVEALQAGIPLTEAWISGLFRLVQGLKSPEERVKLTAMMVNALPEGQKWKLSDKVSDTLTDPAPMIVLKFTKEDQMDQFFTEVAASKDPLVVQKALEAYDAFLAREKAKQTAAEAASAAKKPAARKVLPMRRAATKAKTAMKASVQALKTPPTLIGPRRISPYAAMPKKGAQDSGEAGQDKTVAKMGEFAAAFYKGLYGETEEDSE